MNYVPIIIAAAKAAKVSSALLVAICTYESDGLKNIKVEHDGKGDTPSYGICMVKQETAEMLGYTGTPDGLMNPRTNAKWAAKYLAYHAFNRYDNYGSNDWCKLTAAYNAGTYFESKKVPGKPRNLIYVRRVQKFLEEDLQDRLSCDTLDEEVIYDAKNSKTNQKATK